MLTVNNLTKEFSNYTHFFTDNLNKAYPDIAESIDLYGHDNEIDEVIDDFIGKCNRIIEQHGKSKKEDNLSEYCTKMTEEIASEIIRQLGGSKFKVMTGAKKFIIHDYELTFRIGKNKTRCNIVGVRLTGADYYELLFYFNNKILKRYEGVSCDQLQDIFTDFTGLYTSLIPEDKNKTEKNKTVSKPKNSARPLKREDLNRKTAVSKLKKKTATKTTKKKTSPKPKKEDNVKYVESIDMEVGLIKRFALLHNKTKTVGQLTTLLTALKKAILQKKIRANSIFTKEVKEMEKRLVKFIEFVKQQKADEVKISIYDYERFKEIGNSEKVIKAVTYIIRYMGLINKPNIDNKAENLLNHINKAFGKGEIDKNYMDTIKFIKTNLSKFDSNKKLLEIPQTTLKGLQGLNGLNGFDGLGSLSSILHELVKPEPEMISAQQLARMDFNNIELEPEFEEVLGRIAKSCAIMISGEPGSGKSSFALLFAKSRAEQGKNVLYITSEEGINSTMKDKIIRYKATLPNLIITTKIPNNKSSYDDIIFDSAQTLQLTPEDIRNNKNLNADLCFYVFQVTKGGVFRGAKDFEHEVDVVLKAQNGIVSSKGLKNRFGGNGELRVY